MGSCYIIGIDSILQYENGLESHPKIMWPYLILVNCTFFKSKVEF